MKGPRMKNAAYVRGVTYVAFNDEPGIDDANEMEGFASVQAVSEMSGVSARTVARDVVDMRNRVAS